MDLIKDIKDRIQFLVTIELFFSTLVYGFYKAIGESELVANSNAFTLGLVLVFSVLSYLLIGAMSSQERGLLAWIKHSISLTLVFSIVPIMVFVITMKSSMAGLIQWPFKISLMGLLYTPIATFALVVFGVIKAKFKLR